MGTCSRKLIEGSRESAEHTALGYYLNERLLRSIDGRKAIGIGEIYGIGIA